VTTAAACGRVIARRHVSRRKHKSRHMSGSPSDGISLSSAIMMP